MAEEIESVGIIGEGKMGTNLFYYLLDFGFLLTWVCSKDADTEKITRTFNKKIKRLAEAGIINETNCSKILANTDITSDIQQLKNCDLVIEAIPEDIDLKQQLFARLEKIVSSDCVIASNSSSIRPSELSGLLISKNRVVGLHFFYPVALKNIVEIIIPEGTSTVVTERIRNFLSGIKRDHLQLKEDYGFILNRIYLDFQNEAFLATVEEKLTFSRMDSIIKSHFFPAGVFDFCDSVGNDIMLASVKNYIIDYPEKDHYTGFTRELERLVNDHRLGIKSGSGFYSYPAEEIEHDLTMNESTMKMITERLHSTMISSIEKFSSLTGINTVVLNNAMKEYLGSDRDLIPIQR
jgi:3-hydroxybutyryl-CoA dehydrogenase